MKNPLVTQIITALIGDLQSFGKICEAALLLATEEHEALVAEADYQPFSFYQKRKTLLPEIESLLQKFRNHRLRWQQIPPAEREHFAELKSLFEKIQGALMKVLQLDRENQQAMLKRGLVPVKHLPSMTVQPPPYVANLYRRNSTT